MTGGLSDMASLLLRLSPPAGEGRILSVAQNSGEGVPACPEILRFRKRPFVPTLRERASLVSPREERGEGEKAATSIVTQIRKPLVPRVRTRTNSASAQPWGTSRTS